MAVLNKTNCKQSIKQVCFAQTATVTPRASILNVLIIHLLSQTGLKEKDTLSDVDFTSDFCYLRDRLSYCEDVTWVHYLLTDTDLGAMCGGFTLISFSSYSSAAPV